MNYRWVLILLLILSVLIWLQKEDSNEIMPKQNQIDYFATGLKQTQFDPQGQIKYRFEAKTMQKYRHIDQIDFEQPNFMLWQKKAMRWHIQAQTGWKKDNHIFLKQQVNIHRFGAEPMQINTDFLKIDPNKQYAETDHPIRLCASHYWLRSVGMNAWLNPPEKILLNHQTSAYYVVDHSVQSVQLICPRLTRG